MGPEHRPDTLPDENLRSALAGRYSSSICHRTRLALLLCAGGKCPQTLPHPGPWGSPVLDPGGTFRFHTNFRPSGPLQPKSRPLWGGVTPDRPPEGEGGLRGRQRTSWSHGAVSMGRTISKPGGGQRARVCWQKSQLPSAPRVPPSWGPAAHAPTPQPSVLGWNCNSLSHPVLSVTKQSIRLCC